MKINADELFNKTFRRVDEAPKIEKSDATVDNSSQKEEKRRSDAENVSLLERVDGMFSINICERGLNYYTEGKVYALYKDGNIYHSKVRGHLGEIYTVNIEDSKDRIEYICDCPCEYPCKHIFATLIAIENGDCEEVELKPYLEEKTVTIDEFIEAIPSDKLKSYILEAMKRDNITIDVDEIEENFREYLPRQDYEYYLNLLYNSIILDDDHEIILHEYLLTIKDYINRNDFFEGFKISKSIIEAYEQSGHIRDDDHFISCLPELGMYLRVVYRKVDPIVREKINMWISDLKALNFYDNYYLEDMILGVGRLKLANEEKI